MRYLLILAACALSLSSTKLQARDRIPLSEYLETEINNVNNALIEGENENIKDDNQDHTWYFRRIWMRLRPNVTFTVEIAKIGIVPELELLWERPLPEGWGTYKP